jgi:hypothetical protein
MWRSRLVCVFFALCSSACSQCESERAPLPADPKPSAAPRARASEPVRDTRRLPPPVTPKVAPQLVACGDRAVYRITQKALEVFELAEELPPPRIRGSRIARQTMEIAVEEPLNVFSLGRNSAVVIARSGVFRYELGQARARRYGPIEAKGPLVAWTDRHRADAFRVHAGRERIETYALGGPASVDSDGARAKALTSQRVTALSGFDGRLFTVLADGTPVYSTTKGLVRGDEMGAVPVSEPSGRAVLLFADASPDRYWAADASGHLALWDRKQGHAPLATPSVPGVVIDAAHEGERVAVLSMSLVGDSYLPAVTLFANGREQARIDIGASIGARGQPKLDLCVVTGRPWVIVGSTLWMQLVDWESRRLLAEW